VPIEVVEAPQVTEVIPLDPHGAALPEATSPAERLPVDLPTALRLAGANNLQIRLAAERVREAQAQSMAASSRWLPSLNAAVGFNKHVGRIQDTRGDVFDVDRTSLYSGAGALVTTLRPSTFQAAERSSSRSTRRQSVGR